MQVVLSGATGCPSAWHISYSGFLMSGVSKASTAICVNGDSSLRTESDVSINILRVISLTSYLFSLV